jgi:hypothetical protein
MLQAETDIEGAVYGIFLLRRFARFLFDPADRDALKS